MQVPRNPAVAAVLLVVLSGALLLAGTASLPLLDRDEPRFSHATIEMIERSDWVVPYFNDEYRFDKPPLTYWLMALGYAAFGFDELGARIHTVLSALGMTLLVFFFGRRLLGYEHAFLAALAWSTCVQVFIHGRLAVADMPMVLAVALAHWALWELLFAGGGARWQLVLWLAAALGFLAKGPIALAVPAFTLVVMRILGGRGSVPWRALGLSWGVPLSLGLIGLWGIPALLRTGGAFWDVGIGEHVVRRGVAAFNDRPVVPGYYLVTVLLSLFPWSPWLGQLPVTLRRRWHEPTTRFLVGWLAGPFLIFSFYSTQLPHYTLPAFPALLFLLLREGDAATDFPRPSRIVYYAFHGMVAAVLAGLIAYALWHDVSTELQGLQVAVALLAATLLALQAAALAAGTATLLRRRLPLAAALIVVAALTTSLFAATVRPVSLPVRLLPYYDRVPAEALHVGIGYEEPSLVFYSDTFWRLGRPPTRAELREPILLVYRGAEHGLDRLFAPGAGALRRDAVAACAATPEGAAASTPETREIVDARARAAGVPSFVIRADLERAVVCGFNFARSTWTELLVFYRELPRRPPGR